MATLLDTGIVYAYYDADDAWHERAAAVYENDTSQLLLPSVVIPEVDHLLGRRLGRAAREAFYAGLLDGSYLVVELPAKALDRAIGIDRQWADLDLGFVDAAVLATAESMSLPIATTDRRDFEPVAATLGLMLVE